MGGQAFSGPRLHGFHLEPEKLVIVGGDGPNDVPGRDSDGNVHHLYDERVKLPLSEEFILNVMTLGVKKNVLITKIDGKGYVIDGRQRVRAARAANKRLIQVGEPPIRVPVVQQGGEEQLHMLIGISTNEFNHADTLLVKARKAQRLKDRGLTAEEIAMAFGVTPKSITVWSQMLSLSESVKQAVEAGKVSASAAAQLHTLPPTEQKTQLDILMEASKETGKPPTAKDTAKAAKRAKGQDPSIAPPKKVLRYIVEKRQVHEDVLSEDFVAGVAFAIGLRDAKSISGLSDVVKTAKAAPAKKKGA